MLDQGGVDAALDGSSLLHSIRAGANHAERDGRAASNFPIASGTADVERVIFQ